MIETLSPLTNPVSHLTHFSPDKGSGGGNAVDMGGLALQSLLDRIPQNELEREKKRFIELFRPCPGDINISNLAFRLNQYNVLSHIKPYGNEELQADYLSYVVHHINIAEQYMGRPGVNQELHPQVRPLLDNVAVGMQSLPMVPLIEAFLGRAKQNDLLEQMVVNEFIRRIDTPEKPGVKTRGVTPLSANLLMERIADRPQSPPRAVERILDEIDTGRAFAGPKELLIDSLLSAVASPQHGIRAEKVIQDNFELNENELYKLRVAHAKRTLYQNPETDLVKLAEALSYAVPYHAEMDSYELFSQFITPAVELVRATEKVGIDNKGSEITAPFQAEYFKVAVHKLPDVTKNAMLSFFGFDTDERLVQWLIETNVRILPSFNSEPHRRDNPLDMVRELTSLNSSINTVSLPGYAAKETRQLMKDVVANLCDRGWYTSLPKGIITRIVSDEFTHNTDAQVILSFINKLVAHSYCANNNADDFVVGIRGLIEEVDNILCDPKITESVTEALNKTNVRELIVNIMEERRSLLNKVNNLSQQY